MVYDGKTYRNLQDQVAYLTAKYKELEDLIEAVRAQIPSKMIVEELPEEGDPLITYYVGPKGTDPNYYYEVWVWVQEEPDGPFVWRELEDTDQVDLSGYLQKVTTSSTEKQVYTKNADGTQSMTDVAHSVVAGAIPLRGSSGQILVPTGTPSSDSAATSKGYVVGNFLAKQTGSSSYVQVYAKATDGSQEMLNVNGNPISDSIPFRFDYGHIKLPNETTYPPTDDDYAVSKRYTDYTYLAKQTGSSTYQQIYAKYTDGGQVMLNSAVGQVGNAIVQRNASGQVYVPATPTEYDHAASKKYVDDAVGQLIYTHAITLSFTVNSRSFILNITLLNDDSTAYTSASGEDLLEYIQDGVYSITTDSYRNASYWSVAVCPSDKYRHSDTGIGFYLTAGVDGATIYVDGIDPDYNSDISGVTVTDLVTTW